MKTYVAYVRVSTARQGGGASLPEQKHAIEAYAARHRLTISEWFEERETAAKRGRRIFMQVLAQLEQGRVSGVIVHKIDRSARNLKDWAELGELIDRGVEVHFAHESLDLNTRGGRLAADIQAVVAADYVRNLRDEVLKGFYGRLKQGFYPLPAPLGYLDRGAGKPKALDPVRAPLVRQLFELYASGRFSLHTVRAEVTRRGLLTRVGKPLSKSIIARMLHNPFYTGIIRIDRTGEVFEGVHEPLVTKRIFDRARAVADGRLHAAVVKHEMLFRRMITCSKCGRSLTGERQKGHVYYRCHTPTCRAVSLREDLVLANLTGVLGLVTLDPEEERDLRDLGEEEMAGEAGAEEVRQAQLRQAIARCTDRLDRLTDAFLDSTIDKATFDERKARLLGERTELYGALAEPLEAHGVGNLLKKFELGNAAYLQLESVFPAEKREAVETLVSNLVAEGKELGIRLHFPFDRVAEARFSRKGGPSGLALRNGAKKCEIHKRAPSDLTARDGLYFPISTRMEGQSRSRLTLAELAYLLRLTTAAQAQLCPMALPKK